MNVVGPGSRLTPRRIRCLQLKVDGLTNARVAQVLGISPAGVRNHLAEARELLGARSTAQAACLAYARGLVK